MPCICFNFQDRMRGFKSWCSAIEDLMSYKLLRQPNVVGSNGHPVSSTKCFVLKCISFVFQIYNFFYGLDRRRVFTTKGYKIWLLLSTRWITSLGSSHLFLSCLSSKCYWVGLIKNILLFHVPHFLPVCREHCL